nr:MAG TPA: hypothetical protein [Caudoviricetes sp.]
MARLSGFCGVRFLTRALCRRMAANQHSLSL